MITAPRRLASGVQPCMDGAGAAAGDSGGACARDADRRRAGAGRAAVVTLVEPALALVLMLCLAPLKTLIATEAPIAFPVDVGQMSFALVVGTWAVWRVTQRPP